MLSLNLFSIFSPVYAVDVNPINIVSTGDCGSLLIYKGIYVKTYYTQYTKDGVNYPTYCLDKTKQGVKDGLSYDVSVQNAINDVKLWRTIVNGYPYKSIQELGCANKEEAFTATKQAIYCYIHGNNPADYRAVGEAGQRTLNALNKIVNDANNSTEVQVSNKVNVIKENDLFKVDSKNKEYVSKIYSIQAGTTISNYKVELKKLNNELPEGIKIVDINNNDKTEFAQSEKFKIMIPIKNLTSEGDFNIDIKTKINSKPVLYGKAPNASYQDYALTAATYDDASGLTKDRFFKNETKVKIIKQDQDSKDRLENVEFNIYDSNKNLLYSNMKTDKNGEIQIDNFLPGKYFIKETSAKDGYILNDKLVEFDISYNQMLTLTVNNIFKIAPKTKTEEKDVSADVEHIELEEKVQQTQNKEIVVKRLPVTGM